ncbi:MAG: V-type ATPase subunit [bacterium]
MRSLAQKAQEETRWNYLSGRIKALEKELISPNQYQSLISAKDQYELLRSLSDSPYKSIVRQEEDLFDYEKILNDHLAAKLQWIRKYSPQTLVYDYFTVRGNIQSFKAGIKSYLSQLPRNEELSEQRLEDTQFYGSAFKGDEIPQEYLTAYREVIRKYREKKSLQAVDFEADRQMLAILHQMADASSNEMMRKYTQSFIELKNLCALWRLKALGAPAAMISDIVFIPPQSGLTMNIMLELYEASYDRWPLMLSGHGYRDVFTGQGASREMSSTALGLEKRCDDFLMDILKRAKYIPFGIEVAFAYTAALFMEVLNIKIIIIAKINHVTEDLIRVKVRQGYV